jgi:hypothetical protein
MEELNIPGGRPFLEACSDAIAMKAKRDKISLARAYQFILPRALDAQKRGELTKPIFWMRDAAYEPKQTSAIPLPTNYVPPSEEMRRLRAGVGR